MKKRRVLYISGLDANFLLFALDEFCKTDRNGKVQSTGDIPGYTLEDIQHLRDSLFTNHQHPEELE